MQGFVRRMTRECGVHIVHVVYKCHLEHCHRYKGKTYVWTRDPAAGQEFVHPELLQGAGAPVATKRFRCGAASARDDQAGDRNQVKAVFHRITADPYLTLAVGSEVIATANFGDVANGTRGVVKAFLQLDDGEQMHYDEIKLLHDGSRGGRPRGVQADDIRHLYPQVHAQRMWPEVEWTDSNGKKSVSVVMPMWFSVNDYHCGSEICARLQLPLLPSYALTVHKAQVGQGVSGARALEGIRADGHGEYGRDSKVECTMFIQHAAPYADIFLTVLAGVNSTPRHPGCQQYI